MAVRSEITTITPHIARKMLEHNSLNRKVRLEAVRKYARDMLAKAWLLNGEAIKQATNGDLLDGQHRLLACIEADVPFQTVLITGLPVETKETMDTGAPRSFVDLLRWREEKDVASLGAVITASLTWDKNGTPIHSGAQFSNHEKIAWLEANPDVREAVRTIRFARAAPLRIPSSAFGPVYLRAARLSAPDAAVWVEKLKTGTNLEETNSIGHMRTWAINAATGMGKRDRSEYAAVLIKCWNAWILGRPMRNLRWARGGANREAFPVLLGLDGRTYDETMADPTHTSGTIEAPETRRNLSEFGLVTPAATEQAV